jgi:hypothetical protein
MNQWWNGLTRQQKARMISHGLVGIGAFAVGTKVKGPAAGVVAGGIGIVAHEVLDIPVAMLLINFGIN